MQVERNEEKARIIITRGNDTTIEYVPACDYFPHKFPVFFFRPVKEWGREKIVVKSHLIEL